MPIREQSPFLASFRTDGTECNWHYLTFLLILSDSTDTGLLQI